MKIGIVSCYYHHNYGSMLQAYATQQFILKTGHEAITIQCLEPIHYMTQSKIQYYFHKLIQPDTLLRKLRQVKSVIQLRTNAEVMGKIRERDNKFNEFYKNHILLSPLCKSRSELTSFASNCDAVIVGSDMLWNPSNIEHDYYTLTFVPNAVKKISYATSFGTTRLPKYQQETARAFLNRFYALSVREKSGVDLIRSLGIDKNAQVVLDPTLLFDAAEWNLLPCENTKRGNYILCYFLGVNQEHRAIANKIKALTGWQIVALQHLDEYVREDERFGDIKPFDVGPAEFVDLIRNASFVCTDSFHGTCFSILYHKKFLTFNRFFDENLESTNTRIDSLLSMTGLTGRRIGKTPTDDELRSLCFADVDFFLADEQLAKERRHSTAYLVNALGTGNE